MKEKQRISAVISEDAFLFLNSLAANMDRTPHWLHCKILEDYAKSKSSIKKPAKKTGAVSNDDTEESFKIIWSMYGKKGNRKTSLEKFSKLSIETMQLIFDHIPAYVRSTPDKQYRKNFETYINQNCWMDEINETSQPINTNISKIESAKQELQRTISEFESPDNNGQILDMDDRDLFQ